MLGRGRVERSPLAKAAADFQAAVGHTTRGFESLPSPPTFFAPGTHGRHNRSYTAGGC
jgi:hypothetical protein